jgi:hypothetical protein
VCAMHMDGCMSFAGRLSRFGDLSLGRSFGVSDFSPWH